MSVHCLLHAKHWTKDYCGLTHFISLITLYEQGLLLGPYYCWGTESLSVGGRIGLVWEESLQRKEWCVCRFGGKERCDVLVVPEDVKIGNGEYMWK